MLLRGFAIEAFQIPSGSMLPTLQIGDYVLVDKLRYGVRLGRRWLLRFGAPFPSGDAVEIAKQLFAHVVLVGAVIGWVAKR